MQGLGRGLRLAVVLCAIAVATMPLAAGSNVKVRIVSPDIEERTVEMEKGALFTVPTRLRDEYTLDCISDQLGDIYSPGQNIVVNYDVTLTYNWIKWEYDDGGITITGYDGERDIVSIPKSINNTAVTSIGAGAFSWCTSLTSIEIPDSVTSIGDFAFTGCWSLTSIEIPESVKNIGYCAFNWCASLTSIKVNPSNPIYYSMGNCLIRKSDGVLLFGCKNSVIPDDGSITSIGESAFWDCTSLTSIVIPDSVTSIGDSAFEGCSRLTSIEIHDSVISIGEKAFGDCRNLSLLTIPNSVTSIGDSAFEGCSRLTSIEIPGSVTRIGDGAFRSCDDLASITVDPDNPIYYSKGNCLIRKDDGAILFGCKNSFIPDDGSITSIGDWAFFGCTGLTSLKIPNSVTRIGFSAFGFSGLASITIPESVTRIYRGAFVGCSDLTSITVNPDNPLYYSKGNCLIRKNDGALLSGCRNSVIPDDDSITSIGWSAFSGCTGLTSVKIPNSVKRIGTFAFGFSGLASITIPDSVTSIGEDAFCMCSSLTSIEIPDSVTSIGGGAFKDCTSLTSITIPSSVRKVGYKAFSGWKSSQIIIIAKGTDKSGWDNEWSSGCDAKIVLEP